MAAVYQVESSETDVQLPSAAQQRAAQARQQAQRERRRAPRGAAPTQVAAAGVQQPSGPEARAAMVRQGGRQAWRIKFGMDLAIKTVECLQNRLDQLRTQARATGPAPPNAVAQRALASRTRVLTQVAQQVDESIDQQLRLLKRSFANVEAAVAAADHRTRAAGQRARAAGQQRPRARLRAQAARDPPAEAGRARPRGSVAFTLATAQAAAAAARPTRRAAPQTPHGVQGRSVGV